MSDDDKKDTNNNNRKDDDDRDDVGDDNKPNTTKEDEDSESESAPKAQASLHAFMQQQEEEEEERKKEEDEKAKNPTALQQQTTSPLQQDDIPLEGWRKHDEEMKRWRVPKKSSRFGRRSSSSAVAAKATMDSSFSNFSNSWHNQIPQEGWISLEQHDEEKKKPPRDRTSSNGKERSSSRPGSKKKRRTPAKRLGLGSVKGTTKSVFAGVVGLEAGKVSVKGTSMTVKGSVKGTTVKGLVTLPAATTTSKKKKNNKNSSSSSSAAAVTRKGLSKTTTTERSQRQRQQQQILKDISTEIDLVHRFLSELEYETVLMDDLVPLLKIIKDKLDSIQMKIQQFYDDDDDEKMTTPIHLFKTKYERLVHEFEDLFNTHNSNSSSSGSNLLEGEGSTSSDMLLQPQFDHSSSRRRRRNQALQPPSHHELSEHDEDLCINSLVHRGISLQYILEVFIPTICGGRDNSIQDKTTAQVCEDIIKPLTQELQTSYCEIMQHHNTTTGGGSSSGDTGSGNGTIVSKATHFVSHSHQYKFIMVIDAIQQHLLTLSKEEESKEGGDVVFDLANVYIWLDIFSINQHRTNWAYSWLSNTFKQTIQEIQNVIVVIPSWHNPIPLQRTWCIYEIFCCSRLHGKCNVHIAVAPAETAEAEEGTVATAETRTVADDYDDTFFSSLDTIQHKSMLLKGRSCDDYHQNRRRHHKKDNNIIDHILQRMYVILYHIRFKHGKQGEFYQYMSSGYSRIDRKFILKVMDENYDLLKVVDNTILNGLHYIENSQCGDEDDRQLILQAIENESMLLFDHPHYHKMSVRQLNYMIAAFYRESFITYFIQTKVLQKIMIIGGESKYLQRCKKLKDDYIPQNKQKKDRHHKAAVQAMLKQRETTTTALEATATNSTTTTTTTTTEVVF